MSSIPRLPSRKTIEGKWRALIAGDSTREETAAWAHPWAWAEERLEGEVLAMSGLQSLDGFDLTYHVDAPNLLGRGHPPLVIGEGRVYLHSDEYVESELDRWLARLEEHDRDPEAFFARIRAAAEAARLSE